MILQGDRLLAQAMMTYPGARESTNPKVTAAVDLQVVKSAVETKRDYDSQPYWWGWYSWLQR